MADPQLVKIIIVPLMSIELEEFTPAEDLAPV